MRNFLYTVLESSNPKEIWSEIDDFVVTALVIIDVTDFVLGTSVNRNSQYSLILNNIEIISVTCFTILYILQLWSCTADPQYEHPIWGRIRYALTPLVIIDLLAILPFYLLLL